MMHINPTPIKKYTPVWEVEMFDLPEDSFFKNDELWKENNFQNDEGGLYQESTRLTYKQSNNVEHDKIMNGFLNKLSTENVINIVTDLFNLNEDLFYPNYPYVKTKYKTNEEFVRSFINAVPFAVKDKPTFKLAPHVDNRFVFGNIIYNLTDNKTSTKIYCENNQVLYESSLSKGKGLFFLNTERTFHSYENNTDEDRYAAICNILLNVFNR